MVSNLPCVTGSMNRTTDEWFSGRERLFSLVNEKMERFEAIKMFCVRVCGVAEIARVVRQIRWQDLAFRLLFKELNELIGKLQWLYNWDSEEKVPLFNSPHRETIHFAMNFPNGTEVLPLELKSHSSSGLVLHLHQYAMLYLQKYLHRLFSVSLLYSAMLN